MKLFQTECYFEKKKILIWGKCFEIELLLAMMLPYFGESLVCGLSGYSGNLWWMTVEVGHNSGSWLGRWICEVDVEFG